MQTLAVWDAELGCVGCRPQLAALDPAPPALALLRVVESQAPGAAMSREVTPGLRDVAGFSIWP